LCFPPVRILISLNKISLLYRYILLFPLLAQAKGALLRVFEIEPDNMDLLY
jgi:hypothetical protein